MQAPRILTLAFALALGTLGLRAQVLDLPVGRTANPEENRLSIEGGVAFGSGDLFGARGNFSVSDDLLVGVDLVHYDLDEGALGLGAFGQYRLPLDLPLPLAARAGFGTTVGSDLDVSEFSGEVVTGMEILPGLSWYANAGLHHVRVSVDFGPIETPTVTDTFLAVGGGVVYALNERASVYAGLELPLGDAATHDDAIFGAGIRWAFE